VTTTSTTTGSARPALRVGRRPWTKLLVFADAAAAAPLVDKRWKGHALAGDGIALVVLELAAELQEQVLRAQTRQFR